MTDADPTNDADTLYLKSLSILYVEDEDEVRDQLKTYLQRRCRKVYTAANGKKGIEAYKKHHPDIVITDILMPIMDGLKMSETIQEIAPHVPIIITTAFEEPRYFHRSIELGVHQYVTKPIKLSVLEHALLKCARTLRAEAALKEIEERYRVLFKLSHIAISVADADHGSQHLIIGKDSLNLPMEGGLIDCNDAFLELIGYQDIKTLQVQGHNIYSIMTEASATIFNDLVHNELLVKGFSSEFELELLSQDKAVVPVIAQLILRYSETGEPMEIWVVMRDIRERRKIEEKLRLSAKVFESSKDAIIISDQHNKIISVNSAFSDITGYAGKDVLGQNPNILQSGRHDKEFYQQLWSDLMMKGYWQGEIWNRRKSGEVFPEWISISIVYNDANEISHFIAIFSDISDKKNTEAHIQFLANYDPLTQLPNRRLFIDRLDQAIKTAAREKSRLAVLFFDLDHFKTINDSLGHSIGDQMLIEVSSRISDCMREIDSVSRLSGDEFAAVIADMDEIGDVIIVVQKIITAIRKAFKINQYELHVTISIGISVYPNDGKNYEVLLKNADTAMYCAKNNGRDNFEFFSASMSTQALERLSLEGSLRKAVENNELLIYYQPQIQVDTGKIVGMEALLRWPHAEMGMIPPSKFIPLAEETGLINPIGKWVLQEACRQNKAWQDQGLIAVQVAVNLSAVQFRQHNLLEIVKEALSKSGLKPCFLELELTEGLLMDCSEFNITLLREFRQLGVELSIDDFGTGYSSLSYLKRFPINKLKIDRSFCMDLPKDRDNASITSAIISLGHDLGLCVIAEGVEKIAQFNFLQAQQCDEIQGYLFSQPLPADEMQALLRKGFMKTDL
ncbi:MAG: EAL domain-containing protein [Methyloprofundus sp.]|nr:EAL domain-containing protein [Methyloprofundus sp.]